MTHSMLCLQLVRVIHGVVEGAIEQLLLRVAGCSSYEHSWRARTFAVWVQQRDVEGSGALVEEHASTLADERSRHTLVVHSDARAAPCWPRVFGSCFAVRPAGLFPPSAKEELPLRVLDDLQPSGADPDMTHRALSRANAATVRWAADDERWSTRWGAATRRPATAAPVAGWARSLCTPFCDQRRIAHRDSHRKIAHPFRQPEHGVARGAGFPPATQPTSPNPRC